MQSLGLQDLAFVRMSRRSRRRKQNRRVRYRDRNAKTNSNDFHVCLFFAFPHPVEFGTRRRWGKRLSKLAYICVLD